MIANRVTIPRIKQAWLTAFRNRGISLALISEELPTI
jgi:hypothetical protein